MLVVPDKLAKSLPPRRSIPGSASPPSPRALAALQRALKKTAARKNQPPLAKGLEVEEQPELDAVRREAFAIATEPTEARIAAASLDALGIALRMFRQMAGSTPAIEAVAAVRGAADTVEATARMLGFELTAQPGNWMRCVYVVRGGRLMDRDDELWLSLRHAVCAADDDAYAAARAVAERLRDEPWAPTPEIAARAWTRLAAVFPDEGWANHALRDLVAASQYPDGQLVRGLLTAVDDAALARSLIGTTSARWAFPGAALSLAHVLPPGDAIPLLADALADLLADKRSYGAKHKTPPRDLLAAIACFHTEDAARVVARYAAHKWLAPQVAEYFRDVPELVHVLEAESGGASSRELVAQIRQRADVLDEAPDDAVPALLRTRAWRAPKGAKKPPVVRGLEIAPHPDEHVRPAREAAAFEATHRVRDMTPAERASWRDRRDRGGWMPADFERVTRYDQPAEFARIDAEDGLRAHAAGRGYLMAEPEFVTRHGLAALPGLTHADWLRALSYDSERRLSTLERFVSPRAALAFAQLADRKAYRRRGLDWLDAHAEMAALGLVPYAIGVGSDVRLARDALRHLVRVGHEAAIRAAARTYGPEAVAAIDALLAIDPLVLDKKPPKPPPFLRPDDLPVLELKAGGALPTDARDALLELLSLLEPGAAYPGLDAIRDALTPESLEAFVMGLLSQWVLGDAPGRHDWMLHACVTLPSAAATRRLGEHTRAWARASQAKASRACGALAAIGDELALLHLGHVAETTRFSKLKREARDLLDAVASRRGLTRDELEDRTVPDLGLDPDGALRLGYGPADRAFVVRLDETLAVRVTDASGAALRSLPRARDTDDEARVKEAKARYDALKKDVAAIADRQTRRLERAMVLARAWDLDFAKDRIFQHPLVRHVARGLVWIDGNGVAFRPTDDGAFADASDEAVTPSGPVRIAHPLELADRETWAALFTDYELLQPFEQLGRATREPTANERALTALDPGVELSPRKLLGLMESRGWRRSDPGWITAYLRGGTTADGDRIELRAELSPGIEIAYLRHASDVRVTRVTAERGGDVIPLGVLSAITFSELVRDLDALK